jgi:hypothetical protein
VAKKKNSVALFEVIQKTRRGEGSTDVPKWMGGQAAAAGESAWQERQERLVRPSLVARARESLFAIAGDRLRLSLDYASCAVAVLGLVALLAGAFALGYWSGSGRAENGEGAAGTMSQRTQFGKHVLGGAPPGRADGSATKPAGTGSNRQKGKWYLVIQGLAGVSGADLDEAARIVAYCSAKGEPATVARYTSRQSGKQRYIVWSLKGHDSSTSEEAKKHGMSIEGIGKEYFDKYKTYDFRQRKTDGRFDPWFEVQR